MTNIVSFCIIFSNKIYKFVTNYNSMKVLVEEVEKKVQELVLLYASVKKERDEILNDRSELELEVKEKNVTINELEEKIKLLRIAKSIGTQEDEKNKESRSKINEYVREIDKCIALLNK